MGLVYSDHFKYQLATKQISLTADTIKAILVRSGFVFNAAYYDKYLNLKATTGTITLSFAAADKSLNRIGGNFITDGFIPGNQIVTTSGTNAGPYTVTSVTASKIIISEAIVDEAANSFVVTAQDELPSGYGYTQNSKTLGGKVLTEDDANDRSELSCDDFYWSASGGTIGPTAGVLFFDDTTSDDTIIGYFAFPSEQSAGPYMKITVEDLRFYLS